MRISDWSSDVCSSDLLKAYVGDARPATRRDLNQPLFLEQHQRFAHGGAARAETSGEFDGIEVRTGRQATFGDRPRDVRRDPAAQRIRSPLEIERLASAAGVRSSEARPSGTKGVSTGRPRG